MKTWMMPQVVVEAFRANEYVAGSCQDSFVSNEEDLIRIRRNNSLDLNGDDGDWGYPEGYMFSTALNDYQWKQIDKDGAVEAWMQIKPEYVDYAENTLHLNVVRQSPTSTSYWAKVYAFYFPAGGNNHYHPVTDYTIANFS